VPGVKASDAQSLTPGTASRQVVQHYLGLAKTGAAQVVVRTAAATTRSVAAGIIKVTAHRPSGVQARRTAYPNKIDLRKLLNIKTPAASALGVVAKLANKVNPSTVRPLSTVGRLMPEVTPQTVGRYFLQPIGDWSNRERAALGATLTRNLARLSEYQGADRDQLHLECTLHWHSLCEYEQRDVLNALVNQHGAMMSEGSALSQWVEHTLLGTRAEDAKVLRDNCDPQTRRALAAHFDGAGNTERSKTEYAHLYYYGPADHGYDYRGFLNATGGVYANLDPKVAAQHHVCIIGAGPAGLIAADGLNRLGVKVTVVEQSDTIGGRMKTVWPEGTDNGSPLEMGAMRFNFHARQPYGYFVERYGFETRPFPNPGAVHTTILFDGKVVATEPGQLPSDPELQEVKAEYDQAMNALLGPIMAARAAGDTAEFRELVGKALERFDNYSFKDGLDLLLKKQGIEWTERKWELYGRVGIGVGGYGGYYGTSFNEELRFLVDLRLEDHQYLPAGTTTLLEAIVKDAKLPEGRSSLEAQGAVRLNTAATDVLKLGKDDYQVLVRGPSGEPEVINATAVITAVGTSELHRMGMTGPQEHSQALMSEALAKAVEKAQQTPATKVAVAVPVELFANLEVPFNVQGLQTRQCYVLPAVNPEATTATIFISYALGDDAIRTASLSGPRQADLLARNLRDYAALDPASPDHQQLAKLADVLDQVKDNAVLQAWSNTEHFGFAFKMDAPGDLQNTRTLWESTLHVDENPILIGETFTFESGFVAGPIATAVHAVQAFARLHGGSLPANSPLDQTPFHA
jgi:monoamine oxidase